MATPGTPDQGLTPSASLPDGGVPAQDAAANLSANPPMGDWVSAANVALAGITGIGFLIVVIGAYLADSDPVIIIGAGIVTIAAMGWGGMVIWMICHTIKKLFNGTGKARKGSRPAMRE